MKCTCTSTGFHTKNIDTPTHVNVTRICNQCGKSTVVRSFPRYRPDPTREIHTFDPSSYTIASDNIDVTQYARYYLNSLENYHPADWEAHEVNRDRIISSLDRIRSTINNFKIIFTTPISSPHTNEINNILCNLITERPNITIQNEFDHYTQKITFTIIIPRLSAWFCGHHHNSFEHATTLSQLRNLSRYILSNPNGLCYTCWSETRRGDPHE